MQDATKRPLISAHRGGRAEAPENTAAAFARAAEMGIPGAECDVRISGDSVAMVIHDATVDRTTGSSGQVRLMTAAELGDLDARAESPDWPTPVAVPTFAEVAQIAREIEYFEVEIKADANERIERLIPLLIEDIDSTEIRDIVKFISFEPGILELCYELAPDIPMALVGVFGSETNIQAAIDLHCNSIAASVSHLNQDVVNAAHQAGLSVTCWTVNTAEDFANMVDWGVDVVTTDRPTMMQTLLEDG
jgi:glycerophosphoryl diester phosphodiesterase